MYLKKGRACCKMFLVCACARRPLAQVLCALCCKTGPSGQCDSLEVAEVSLSHSFTAVAMDERHINSVNN